MNLKIKAVTHDNPDFLLLVKKLDEFQINEIPERTKNKDFPSLMNGLDEITDVLLMYGGNRPVGSTAIKHDVDKRCKLRRVFVEPEYRGLRIAETLGNEIEKIAIAKGYEAIIAGVWKSATSAIKLYERMGYTLFEDCGNEGIYMIKDLVINKEK